MKNNQSKLPVISTEHFDWLAKQRCLVGQISDFGPDFAPVWLGRVFHGSHTTLELKSHKTGDVAAFDLVKEEMRKTGEYKGIRAWRFQGRDKLANVKVTIYNS